MPKAGEIVMHSLLLILLDLAAADDESLQVMISRRPLEALITDWLTQTDEIRILRERAVRFPQGS